MIFEYMYVCLVFAIAIIVSSIATYNLFIAPNIRHRKHVAWVEKNMQVYEDFMKNKPSHRIVSMWEDGKEYWYIQQAVVFSPNSYQFQHRYKTNDVFKPILIWQDLERDMRTGETKRMLHPTLADAQKTLNNLRDYNDRRDNAIYYDTSGNEIEYTP